MDFIQLLKSKHRPHEASLAMMMGQVYQLVLPQARMKKGVVDPGLP